MDNKNIVLSKISEAIIRAKEKNYPMPILDSLKETRIAWNILFVLAEGLQDYLEECFELGFDVILVKEMVEFSFPELAPILTFLNENITSDEKENYKIHTEWIAWRKGILSLREAQVLVLSGYRYEVLRSFIRCLGWIVY